MLPSIQDTRMQCKSGQDEVGCGILADILNIRAHMPNIRRNASIRECPKRCGSESEVGSQCRARGERVSEAVYQFWIFGPIRPVEHTMRDKTQGRRGPQV